MQMEVCGRGPCALRPGKDAEFAWDDLWTGLQYGDLMRIPRLLSLLAGSLVLLVSSVCVRAQAPQDDDEKAATKPAPDVLVFTNGDQLSGVLERGVGDTIVFKSDMAGEISVPLSKVKELRSSGSFAVLRKDRPVSRTTVLPGTIAYSDGQVTVADPTGTPETVPVKQLSFIIDQTTYDRELESKPKAWYGWNGSINAGSTLVRSTQNGTTFNTSVGLLRQIPTVPYLPKRNRLVLNLSETYGTLRDRVIPQTSPPTPDTVVKTSIFHTDLERDEYFTARFYALGQLSFDHNYSQGLDLEQIYGVGIGWTPFQNATQQLDLKADVHYEKQQFQTASSDEDLIGSSLSESYRRVFPRKVIVTETLNLIPAWNDLNAYAANGSFQVVVPVFKRFNVNFTTSDSFLNNPSVGFQKNSFQFVTGVGYTLR